MLLFIVILIFYGLPAAAGILLLRWLIIKYSDKKKANRISIILFSLLIITGVGFFTWDRMQRTHYISYSFCEDLNIELRALEIETFLDWEVEFEMIIKNSKDETIQEFEFSGGNGPYFEIAFDGNSSKVMEISGYGRNIGIKETIRIEDVESRCNGRIRINRDFLIEEQ